MNKTSQRVADLSGEKRNAFEARLLERISAKGRSKVAPVLADAAALSPAQESLWFFDQLQKNSPLYNIAQAFRLTGAVNVEYLQRAFSEVVNRHATLRTSFLSQDGKPVQSIRPCAEFVLPRTDLRGVPNAENEGRAFANREAQRPFDLKTDLLLRAQLIELSDSDRFLVIVLHHIVGDFASLGVLYRELSETYNNLMAGQSAALPALPIQFTDWVAEYKAGLQGGAWDRKANYWKQKLAGELPEIELPTDRPRPAQQSFAGAKHDLRISRELLSSLKELSRREGTTLYLTLLTAFETLVHRFTGQNELIIGSPIDLRNTTEAERLIGYFINTLPLRTKFPDDCTFRAALQEVRTSAMEAFVNQEMPFEKMVEALQVSRATDRNPLFQTVFQYLPSLPKVSLRDVAAEPVSLETATSKFDLTFTLAESEGELLGEIEFSTDLFDAVTISRLGDHFEVLLHSIVASPQQKLSELAILSPPQQHEIVSAWNQTETKYPRRACVHELFEEQVNRTPDAIALQYANEAVTYRQLNERANQLAHRLQGLGVGRDVLVGVALDRSVELIVSLLAILKAGGAYVPLDTAYPRERLDYIVANTRIPVLITTRQFQDLTATAKLILLDSENELSAEAVTNVTSQAAADSLAYVMYTSGSTGKPKGVLIPHRGIVRLVKETNYVRFGQNEVFVQFAPVAFDASTFEIWGALLNGAKLVIYPAGTPSLEELGSFLVREKVTTLWLTAGLFHQMVEHHIETLRGVRQLLAGGDVLSVPQVLKALRELPNCQLINGYGPTENTTFTCCFAVPADWNGVSLPIGKPISNTRVYVVDEKFHPVPIGVPGELFIGGDGLARDYLNAPELSAQKFVRDPFQADPQARLYRTGDRVRWLADGTIEFLGRFDNQVKVRGFRVELGEVENALAQHPEVRETTVLARQNCIGKELVAYVVPKNREMDGASLRSFLQQKLPTYMVPAHFVTMAEFPLTTNGKVDRRRLPSPEKTVASKEAIVPRNEMEQQMHAIWCEVLGQKQISVEANFFELGGHSLIATQIISRATRAFGRDLPLRLIFEFPTIASFVQAVANDRGATASDLSPIRRRGQVNAVRLDQLSDAEIARLLQTSLDQSR